VSALAEVVELYLYDLDVSDELFRRFVLEAVEKDLEQLTGVILRSHPGYQVRECFSCHGTGQAAPDVYAACSICDGAGVPGYSVKA
jgi:hypothetical protein